jgi:hypothetical protein
MTANSYADLESAVLGLPVESRCRLTHVLIRSIDDRQTL